MEKCNHISVNTSNFNMKFIIPNSNGDNKAKPVLDAFINDLSCMFTLALTTASVVKSWNKRIQICQTIGQKYLAPLEVLFEGPHLRPAPIGAFKLLKLLFKFAFGSI